MLLVSGSELVEENAVEVFHSLVLFFLDVKFKAFFFSGKIVSFPHLHTVGQLVVHPPSRILCNPKYKKCPDLYLLIRPLRRPLTLVRERILITVFTRSSPKLAICDVVHSLPLGGVDGDFSFTEYETWRHFSYLPGTFREFIKHVNILRTIFYNKNGYNFALC